MLPPVTPAYLGVLAGKLKKGGILVTDLRKSPAHLRSAFEAPEKYLFEVLHGEQNQTAIKITRVK